MKFVLLRVSRVVIASLVGLEIGDGFDGGAGLLDLALIGGVSGAGKFLRNRFRSKRWSRFIPF